jgi:hypothetical protein
VVFLARARVLDRSRRAVTEDLPTTQINLSSINYAILDLAAPLLSLEYHAGEECDSAHHDTKKSILIALSFRSLMYCSCISADV